MAEISPARRRIIIACLGRDAGTFTESIRCSSRGNPKCDPPVVSQSVHGVGGLYSRP